MALGKRISSATGARQRKTGKRLQRWGMQNHYAGKSVEPFNKPHAKFLYKEGQRQYSRGAQLSQQGNKRGMATVGAVAVVGAAAYGGHKLYKAHQVKTQNPNHAHAFHVARAHSGA